MKYVQSDIVVDKEMVKTYTYFIQEIFFVNRRNLLLQCILTSYMHNYAIAVCMTFKLYEQ